MKETLNTRTDKSLTTFTKTLLEASRFSQLEKEMIRYNIHILGLSEVRWPGQGEHIGSNGTTLLYSGKLDNEPRLNGVGLLLSKMAKKCLLKWTPISDRLIYARFNTKARKVSIIQCYAPTDPSDQADKDIFYDALNAVIDKIPRGDIKIVLGDFNAQVGSDNTNFQHNMGVHGTGTINDNGDLFTNFCLSNDLVIGGTLFPHKQIHKYTWTSPNGKTRNQIDHITISSKWRRSLLDVRNRRGADIASDHELLIAEIRLKICSNKNIPLSTNRKKYQLEKLQMPQLLERFQTNLKNKLENIQTSETPLSSWNDIQRSILETAESVLGVKKRSHKNWISEHTWNLIERRKALKANLLEAATDQDRTSLRKEYTSVNKLVKRSARSDKRAVAEKLASDAEDAARCKNARKLYSITKQLANKGYSSTQHPIKDKNGSPITCPNEQLARWREHFACIISREPNLSEINGTPARTIRINTEVPTVGEIKAAISKLRSNKAAGADNIPAELFKADQALIASTLHPLIGQVWNEETIPISWKEGLIVKLPKKGNLQDCNNWRGITLLNIINKVLSHIILERMSCKLETKLRREQAGFRCGRSCIDHINTLRIIIEQSVEWQTPLYLLFIDFKQAFDTINHHALWQILVLIGTPLKIVNLIKELYNDATCKVTHKGKTSDPIHITSGVKQGCLLSPLLFNILLDWVMRKALNGTKGIQWDIQKQLEDLDYADDICLLSHRKVDIQANLDSIVTVAQTVGLHINVQKTKAMRIGPVSNDRLQIHNEDVEEVEEFCYLGSIVSKTGGGLADVLTRIKKAQNVWGMMKNIWSSNKISRNTKLRIFNTNVKSVLLYGCETWKATKEITQRLQVFVNRCLRRIMRISWQDRICNAELWKLSNQKPIIEEIRMRKWNWIGHVLRRDPNDTSRMALEWNPQGSRKRGRPTLTWRRTVLQELQNHGKSWRQIKTLANSRPRWRDFVRALCSSEEI